MDHWHIPSSPRILNIYRMECWISLVRWIPLTYISISLSRIWIWYLTSIYGIDLKGFSHLQTQHSCLTNIHSSIIIQILYSFIPKHFIFPWLHYPVNCLSISFVLQFNTSPHGSADPVSLCWHTAHNHDQDGTWHALTPRTHLTNWLIMSS